ncbi:Hypothetical protein F387_02034 [Wohlfahrtiimonas chitiniclastica SH04]|uniref:MobA/MobL protein domain-containing protein n=1 Tax=Wohlfahrtiimonas chitiniclastica SH04 TaxID=1261130 RepID=L8XWP0_9GAMM|nr:MobQ family relaxase [Wohlfahrtiimonas chitiniclastica]ELV07170.1 Hypothetical protein F387_02034 [Wohlfahrtiimonas chitiniclastica SH04]
MAIYHCTTKPISRSNGRSATASSAYRAGEKIVDTRTGEIHDYTKKGGVEYSEIIKPKSLGQIEIKRDDLWNLAEHTEKRKDARVAREFIIALPNELTPEKRKEVAQSFTKYLVDRYSVVADLAIHQPNYQGDDRNHHAHIMVTTRQAESVNGELQLTNKANLELSNTKRKSLRLQTTQDDIKEIREEWANIANKALKHSGIKERIDHRSYEDQGKEMIPTKHEGAQVTEMRRKGIITGIAKLNDEIKEENKIIKCQLFEEQQNQKPTLFERIGLKKQEKITEDLPTMEEVISNIDSMIQKAAAERHILLGEKLDALRTETANKAREEERARKEREKAREANRNPLEREYLMAAHGRDQFRTIKEAQAMHKFIAQVEQGADKQALLDEIIQKNLMRITKFKESQKENVITNEDDKRIVLENNKPEINTPEIPEQQPDRQPAQKAKIIKPRLKDRDDDWDMDR